MLGLAVVSALFEDYPELHEGHLSRVRADAVSRRACADVATALRLGERLQTADTPGDGLRASPRVLAATLEAVLGALFLHFGVDPIRHAIAEAFRPAIEASLADGPDPKTRLQELVARTGRVVRYETLGAEGPPHHPSFTAAAVVDDAVLGTGSGRSKKEAEQAAARLALAALEA